MAGLGTFATTAIITKGLHCGPACRGLITTHFSLYCSIEVPPDFNQGAGGGGGPYPHDAWNKIPDINDFYTKTDEQFYEVPRDKEADYFRKRVTVVLKVKLGDNEIEKTYSVPEKRKNTIVRFFNLINATQDRYKVTIRNLKRVINKAKIKMWGLRAYTRDED